MSPRLFAALVPLALARAAAALPPRASLGSLAPRALADSTVVNEYMWYSASTSTVHIALNASVGGTNGGMNFNGGAKGSATITVPAGWKVQMRFTNLDAIPHSAIIITSQDPLPSIPQTPAFAGAYTRDLTSGIPTARGDDLDFIAAPAGEYILLCGVPGHGPSGMWIRFDVAAGVQAPSYQM